MRLNRLKFGLILIGITLLGFPASKAIAQESGFPGEMAKPHCTEDVSGRDNVSGGENLKRLLFYCGREEYTTQPPFR